MCSVGIDKFHQSKFTSYGFAYFCIIRSLEMKERYPLILVCFPPSLVIVCQVITGLNHVTCRNGSVSGLDEKGVHLHKGALAHPRTRHIKSTRVVCRTPKTLYGVLSQLFLIHSFSTLLTTLFLICLVKFLYLTFYLHFFVHIVTFSFRCSCHLLNTLTHIKIIVRMTFNKYLFC